MGRVALESLKRELLELLERDVEFRYAVAGYLGLSEVLKRLDVLAEEQVKLREEQSRIWEEIRAFREEQVKLREDMVAGFRRHEEEMAKLREDLNSLREDFNRVFRQVDARLSRVERTLEKITLDIEEEARTVIGYRLREMGFEVDVGSLILPEVELNIYGVSGDLCVVGEASVRASANVIDRIDRGVERLRSLYPERLGPRVVRVVYTSLATPDLVERAEREGVWVLKATGDIVRLSGLC
ncbi:MAG: hypothetical protein QXF26_10375 [Candidatus Bathyarchaeia archaeon]